MISEPVNSDSNHDFVLSDSICVRNPFPKRQVEADQSRLLSSFNLPGIGANSGRSSDSDNCDRPRPSIRWQHQLRPFFSGILKPCVAPASRADWLKSRASKAEFVQSEPAESAHVCHQFRPLRPVASSRHGYPGNARRPSQTVLNHQKENVLALSMGLGIGRATDTLRMVRIESFNRV